MIRPTPRALLLDLFGTLVHFRPASRDTNPAAPTTQPLPWLREVAEEHLPDLSFSHLLDAVNDVSREIRAARPPHHREVASEERFRRALERLGIAEPAASDTARRLTAAHMRYLAELTFVPEATPALLGRWRERFRLALISNFDHGPTARDILERHGLATSFDVILISAEYGFRKPAPSIFREALQQLGCEAADAVHVGDSGEDDVVGARSTGLRVVLLTGGSPPVLPPGVEPDAQLRDLEELDLLLN